MPSSSDSTYLPAATPPPVIRENDIEYSFLTLNRLVVIFLWSIADQLRGAMQRFLPTPEETAR